MARRGAESGRKFDGARLRQWRLSKSLGQKELADQLGLDRSHISLLERGTRRPSSRVLELLHVRFGVDPKMFMYTLLLAVMERSL
jgi:transcriptional regulator with XRE-family HTH domain